MGNLKDTLREFKNKKILVIGDVVLDRFTWGDVERVNPEQPASPLVKVKSESYKLGGAANVAENLSSLGVSCCLFGVIGKGIYGNMIKELCINKKIKFKYFCNDKPSFVKQRIMAHRQQITRLDFGEEGLEKITPELQEQIMKILRNELAENCYDFIILSDYDKGLLNNEFSQQVINLAKSKNIPVHVDLKPKNVIFFKGCTIISPNKMEAQEIAGIEYSNGKDVLVKMGESLSEKVNSRYVTITLGKDGVFAYDVQNKDCLIVETKAREVADVSGAGDTFAATLPLGLSCGLGLFDAVRLANYASGVVVEKVGTAVPTIEEIEKKIDQDNNI